MARLIIVWTAAGTHQYEVYWVTAAPRREQVDGSRLLGRRRDTRVAVGTLDAREGSAANAAGPVHVSRPATSAMAIADRTCVRPFIASEWPIMVR